MANPRPLVEREAEKGAPKQSTSNPLHVGALARRGSLGPRVEPIEACIEACIEARIDALWLRINASTAAASVHVILPGTGNIRLKPHSLRRKRAAELRAACRRPPPHPGRPPPTRPRGGCGGCTHSPAVSGAAGGLWG